VTPHGVWYRFSAFIVDETSVSRFEGGLQNSGVFLTKFLGVGEKNFQSKF